MTPAVRLIVLILISLFALPSTGRAFAPAATLAGDAGGARRCRAADPPAGFDEVSSSAADSSNRSLRRISAADVLRSSPLALGNPFYPADIVAAELGVDAWALENLDLLSLDEILWRWDGLYGFFLFPAADDAPEIALAMGRAGLQRQRAALQAAMRLFGNPFPRDSQERSRRNAFMTSPAGIPSPFDIALRFQSQASGSLDAYDQELEEAIARDRCLSAAVAALRAMLRDHQRLLRLIDWLSRDIDVDASTPAYREAVLSLPLEFRTLYLASRPTMTHASGLQGMFAGGDGALAPEIAQALEDLRLAQQAAVIREGIAMFGPSFPISTVERRELFFASAGISPLDRNLLDLSARIDRGAIVDAMVLRARADGVLPR
ncbi:hypothetical protein [Aureimonas glaciei]|uniref:DUF4375 domain-containing protein n=1 Tax=Aureimonas glaciei TaxID=1776957 RepID=A0A917D9R2_9HYPH|nr:hypothetical protein [Aureimonas glaciei]GGD14970.1 hypothetical protein GCM10011335_17160 [Aureimonas glaciei]